MTKAKIVLCEECGEVMDATHGDPRNIIGVLHPDKPSSVKKVCYYCMLNYTDQQFYNNLNLITI